MPTRLLTLEEWEALGLPRSSSYIEFGPRPVPKPLGPETSSTDSGSAERAGLRIDSPTDAGSPSGISGTAERHSRARRRKRRIATPEVAEVPSKEVPFRCLWLFN
jgi:hypothetical protein